MGATTGIEWCHHTFNGVRGCTKVSAGCAHCYAEALSKRNPAVLGVWGPHGTRVVQAEAGWKSVLRWNRAAEQAAERRRVFCYSLGDVFEAWDGPMFDSQGRKLFVHVNRDWAPETDDPFEREDLLTPLTIDDVRARLFRLIESCRFLDFLLVTKRPENILSMVPGSWRSGFPRNVWVLASVEDQEMADQRIPHLLKVPAVVRGLSMEPLLEAVDIRRYLTVTAPPARQLLSRFYGKNGFDGEGKQPIQTTMPGVNWVIVGGESDQGAKKARPFWLKWAHDLIGQCRGANVPVFLKQLGSYPIVDENPPEADKPFTVDQRSEAAEALGDYLENIYRLDLRDSHGGDWTEWPTDLCVREFPQMESAQ